MIFSQVKHLIEFLFLDEIQSLKNWEKQFIDFLRKKDFIFSYLAHLRIGRRKG
jgi:predicted AAA+ superfamily ATPase